MVRLAVNGDPEIWNAVGSRLHGATLIPYLTADERPLPPDEFDALLLIAPDQAALSSVESLLLQKKSVHLTPSSGLSFDLLEKYSVAARESGAQFWISNPDRYLPSRQLIQQQLLAGKLGRPGLIRLHRWESAARQSETLTGIPIPLLLDLDLAARLMGAPPNVLYAASPSSPVEADVTGRTIQVHLGFPGGAMALVDYSSALPSGNGYQYLSVMGSLGAAYSDDQQNMQLIFQGQHPVAVPASEGIRASVNLAQDFIDGLLSGRDRSTDLQGWRQAMHMIQAVSQSLSTRQAVALEGH